MFLGESERDSYKLLTSKEFRDLHREGLKSKARLIAIFPRKVILRVGIYKLKYNRLGGIGRHCLIY